MARRQDFAKRSLSNTGLDLVHGRAQTTRIAGGYGAWSHAATRGGTPGRRTPNFLTCYAAKVGIFTRSLRSRVPGPRVRLGFARTVRGDALRVLAIALLVIAGCNDPAYDRPSATAGYVSRVGNGQTEEISAVFGPHELQLLASRLNSVDFQRRLAQYNCGRAVPRFAFRVSIFEPALYQRLRLQAHEYRRTNQTSAPTHPAKAGLRLCKVEQQRRVGDVSKPGTLGSDRDRFAARQLSA